MALPEGKQFNMETMEYEEIPVKEETKKEEEVPDVDDAKKKEEPEPKEEEEEVKEEEEEQKEEVKEEEEQKEEEKEEPAAEKKEEEKEEVIDPDDYLATKYGENFNIKSEEDLDAVLATIDEITAENEALKTQLEEAKKAKPVFANEQEENAYNYLKALDVTRISEAGRQLANLITLPIDKAEPRILLEEKFIFEHPELTREKALKKFNADYTRKYTLKREEFDDEDNYKEQLELKEIDLETDVADAKRFLTKKQSEFKTSAAKEAQDNPTKVSEEVSKSVTAHVSELDSFMKEFDTIIFSPTDSEEDDFTYTLTKEQLKLAQETTREWIGNPKSYNEKGKIDGWVNAEENVIQIAYLLFGNDIAEKAFKHGLTLGETKRADQIAKVKPTREAKVANGSMSDLSEEKQWEMIAKKKKAERSKRQLTA